MPSLFPMPDVFTCTKRSDVMSRIRSKGNASTELALARELRRAGLGGWRRHVPLPGKPDFYYPNERLCIFVHGCFWHGCPRCYRQPGSNVQYWSAKLIGNRRRDARVTRRLRRGSFSVVTCWECQLTAHGMPSVLRRIARALEKRR